MNQALFSQLGLGPVGVANLLHAAWSGNQAINVDAAPTTTGPTAKQIVPLSHPPAHVAIRHEFDARDGSHYPVLPPLGDRTSRDVIRFAGSTFAGGTTAITQDQAQTWKAECLRTGIAHGWPELMRTIREGQAGFLYALDAVVEILCDDEKPLHTRFTNYAIFYEAACGLIIEAAQNVTDPHIRRGIFERLQTMGTQRYTPLLANALPAFDYLIANSAGCNTEEFVRGYIAFAKIVFPYGDSMAWNRLTNMLGVTREYHSEDYQRIYGSHEVPHTPTASRLAIARTMTADVQEHQGHFASSSSADYLAFLAKQGVTVKDSERVLWSARSPEVRRAFTKPGYHTTSLSEPYHTCFPPFVCLNVLWAFPDNLQARRDVVYWAAAFPHDPAAPFATELLEYILALSSVPGERSATQIFSGFVDLEYHDRGRWGKYVPGGHQDLDRSQPSILVAQMQKLADRGNRNAGQLLAEYARLSAGA